MNSIIEALSTNGFALADYLVFGLYIVILVGMGIYLSRGKKGEEKSSTDYFLAGNTLGSRCVVDRSEYLRRTVHRYVGFGVPFGYRDGGVRVDGGGDADISG